MKDVMEPIVTIVLAVISVALVATIVSRNAQTGNVLSAFGSMISNMLSAATGPVTGSVTAPNNSIGGGGSSLGSLSMPQLTMPSIG